MNNLINIWELRQEKKLIKEEMLEAKKGFCYASYREKYCLLYHEHKNKEFEIKKITSQYLGKKQEIKILGFSIQKLETDNATLN